jgi:hypothetical protein
MLEVDETGQASVGESQVSPQQGYNKGHVYRDLQDFDQIRLLHLQPRSGSEKIECTIELAKFSKQPEYEALSYMWGPANPLHSILIDGANFEVRENLWLALQHLRLESESRVLWIDAICINQGNIHERNHQVAQMAQIYQEATTVVVWLGAPDSSSAIAFELLSSPSKWTAFIQPSNDLEVLSLENRQLSALHSLLSREYWKRLWIIQEFLMAQKFLLQCGDDLCPQFRVSWFFQLLKGRSKVSEQNPKVWEVQERLIVLRAIFSSTPVRLLLRREMEKNVKLRRSRPGPVPLEPLYILFENYNRAQCEDPRDRILGLRSLAHDCCKEAVPVQYSLGWEGTLWNLIRHQIFYHPWTPREDVDWSPPKSVVGKIHEIYRQSEEISHYSTNNNSAQLFKAALNEVARSIRYTTSEYSPVVLCGHVRGRICYLRGRLDQSRRRGRGLLPRDFTAMMKIQLKYIFDQCTLEDQRLSTRVSDRLRQPFGRDSKRRFEKYFSSSDGFIGLASGNATSLDGSTLSDNPISYQGSGFWTARKCPKTIKKELKWLLAAAQEAFPNYPEKLLAIEENGLVFFASNSTKIGDLVCQFPDSDIITISSSPERLRGDVCRWPLQRAFNILASPSGVAVDICGEQMTFHGSDRYAFSVEVKPLDLWNLCRTLPPIGELHTEVDSLGDSNSSDISLATRHDTKHEPKKRKMKTLLRKKKRSKCM